MTATLSPPPVDVARPRGQRLEDLRLRRGRGARARRHQRRVRAPPGSPRSWARRARASRRCCTASPVSTASRRGQIFLGDIEISRSSEKQLTLIRRDRIGFVFQAYNLIPTLTADENITLPMSLAGQQARPAVARHDRDDRASRRPPQAPSDRAVRRSAAARRGRRARCVSRPEIVFADEPTGNLDSRSRRRDPDLHAQGGRRPRPDDRDGHPRPDRRAATPTASCSSPTARSSTRCSNPTADSRARPDEEPRGVVAMWKVTIKGILANKVRFVLTGVAVMLGVAFISGTLRAHRDDHRRRSTASSPTSTSTPTPSCAPRRPFSGNFGAGRGTHRRVAPPRGSRQPRASPRPTAACRVWRSSSTRRATALGSNGQGAPTFGFA